MRFFTFIILILLFGCTLSVPKEVEVKYDEIPEKVDFNYHVKPILSDSVIIATDLTKIKKSRS